ncbi:MAG: hypothetical protein IPO98_18700 [Saprospiraceae bacterium]|nr:hypothetical protein [Saprospiraceae bacterium]
MLENKNFHIRISLIISCLLTAISTWCQCNFTQGPVGELCSSAIYICGDKLDGYKSKLPTELSTPQPWPGVCAGSGNADNIIWFAFTPCAPKVSLRIIPSNCTIISSQLRGIQAGFFTKCDRNASVACTDHSNNNGVIAPTILTYGGFVPGKTAYFFIDGYAGSVCEFEIQVIEGIDVLPAQTPNKSLLNKGSITGKDTITCREKNVPIYFNLTKPECKVAVNPSCGINTTGINPSDSICYVWQISPSSGRYFANNDSIGTKAGIVFTSPGIYTISAQTYFHPFYGGSCANAACGDISQWTVIVEKPDTIINPYISVCPGNSYNFNGVIVTKDTILFDTIDLCSVHQQRFKIERNKENIMGPQFVCSGQSYLFQGINYSTGAFEAVDSSDCSLVHKFTVENYPLTIDSSLGTILVCKGTSFPFQGNNYLPGDYNDVKDVSDCTLLHKFKVEIFPQKENDLGVMYVCSGGQFTFQGKDYGVGTYPNIQDSSDCALNHKLIVEVYTPKINDLGTKYVGLGEKFLFQGKLYVIGIYQIPDSSDCALYHKLRVELLALDTLKINIQSKTGEKGSTVCLDFTAENFKNIESIQFNLSYNATLVSPQCPATNVHPGLRNNIFGELFNCSSKVKGFINFVWASDPTTIPDGKVLFTLCFDIIGDPGNSTPITINGNILEMEVCREISGKTVCLNKVNTTPASIDIKTNTLSIFINKCDADIINTTDKGSLTFYATGGLAPYSYNINAGEFTGSAIADGQRIPMINLPQKKYIIVITDNNGLKVTDSITISNNIPITYDKLKTDPLCADRKNGSIKISNLQGGIGPFIYEWSNLVSTIAGDSFLLKDIGVGKYTVTITDFSTGCKKMDSFELVRAPLLMDVKILNNAACDQAGVSGKVEISASGGTPFSTGDPYNLIINSGINFRIKPPYLYSPRAGNFTLRISDGNGCSTDNRPYFMPSDYTIDMTAAVKDVSCKNAKDGSVTMTVSPYSTNNSFFPLFGFPDIGGLGLKSDTLKLNGIPPGNYAYRMIDFNNCKDTVFFTVKEPDSLKINSTVVQPDCSNLGSINLNLIGGKPGYNYFWNPPLAGNMNTLSGLSGGTYKVTVTDANACRDSVSIPLVQQGTLSANPEVVKSISCNGAKDGSVRVDILSSNGPFDIKWTDSAGTVISNSQTLLNLNPGTYTVQVTDNSMCASVPKSVTLTEPSKITFPIPQTRNVTCFGLSTGQATIIGGAAGLSYTWSSGTKGMFAADLIAGQNWVFANNASNCRSETTFFNIATFGPISIDAAKTLRTNPSSFGSTNGPISISATGGTGISYVYSWSNGRTGSTLNNVGAGIYSVTINDSNNCNDTVRFVLSEPASINLNPTIVQPDCNIPGSISLIPSGGKAGYNYT